MDNLSSEPREILFKHNWKDTIPRLVALADQKMKILKWCGVRGGPPPQGNTAEDIASEVILEILGEPTTWDPEESPDLFRFLCKKIRNKISNFVRGSENKKTLRIDPSAEDSEDNLIRYETKKFLESIHKQHRVDGNPMVSNEEERISQDFILGLIDFLQDEPLLIKYVECILDGDGKPNKVALKLEVDEQTVYNMKKRLGRRLEDFQVVFKKNNPKE